MNRIFTVLAATATAVGTVLVVAPSANADARTSGAGTFTSWPAPGTGGLILRDEHGNDLGSGIGEQQDFRLIECGPENSGLIRVEQLTRGGGGGWGTLYEGYVKVEWTMVPSMFDHCA